MILTAILALAVLNALYQLFDLWTTSEVLKRNLGHEDNPRMVGIVQNYAKFAWVKGIMALSSAIYPLVAWKWPETEGLMLFFVAGLVIYYTPIVWNNWKILRGKQ